MNCSDAIGVDMQAFRHFLSRRLLHSET